MLPYLRKTHWSIEYIKGEYFKVKKKSLLYSGKVLITGIYTKEQIGLIRRRSVDGKFINKNYAPTTFTLLMDKQITGCTLLTSWNNSIAVGTKKLLDCSFAYFIRFLKLCKNKKQNKTKNLSQRHFYCFALKEHLLQIHGERKHRETGSSGKTENFRNESGLSSWPKRSHTVGTPSILKPVLYSLLPPTFWGHRAFWVHPIKSVKQKIWALTPIFPGFRYLNLCQFPHP